jgi:hypothetical protein
MISRSIFKYIYFNIGGVVHEILMIMRIFAVFAYLHNHAVVHIEPNCSLTGFQDDDKPYLLVDTYDVFME